MRGSPWRYFDVLGAADGWICSTVEAEGAGGAGLGLELLRGDNHLAVGRVGKDGWPINWTDEDMTIGAVADFHFRCIV